MILKKVINYLSETDDLSDIKEKLEAHHTESREEHERIFSTQRFVDRLISEYREHGNLIVAFDFDDTIEPSDPSFPCDLVINLLQICSKLGFVMICYTARALNSEMDMVRERCKQLQIKCDYVNEHSDTVKNDWNYEHESKVFYNIFLDDRAGLGQAYDILWGFIEWFVEQRVADIDSRKEGY